MSQKDRRYLFLDLDRVRRWDAGIVQRFPQPEKVPISGLEPGAPGSWDARVSTIYGSVLKEDGLFRMWYTVMPDALSHDEDPDHMYSAYAESDDGIHWRKPDLKITGQSRYPGNNLLSLPGCVMGVVPALPSSGAKYLAAVIQYGLEADISEGFGYKDYRGTTIFASHDGLNWRQLMPEALAQQGDVACLVVDPAANRYLLYQKVGAMHGLDARRSFICMESKDGVLWEGYQGMGSWRYSSVCDDYDDLQAMQSGFRIADHYGVAVYRAGDLYIGVEDIFQIGSPLRFEFAQNPNGLCMFRLGFSHNGIHWRHPKGRPVWMPLGKPGEWDAGFAVPASTFVEHDDHLLLYYGGSRYDHGWSIEENFELKKDIALEEQRDSARVMMCRIRKDRFASLSATYQGKVTVDSDRRDDADAFFINALCPQGSVRVAISKRGEKAPLPGFSFDDCIPFSGDETRASVQFREASLADIPADVPLALEFEITRGEIFGYEWSQI